MRPAARALLGATLLAAAAAGAVQLGARRELLPEHTLFDRYLGKWEVRVTAEVPGVGAVESAGLEQNRLGPGGRWLVTELRYELLGAVYEGNGWLNFDPHRRAYVSAWFDGEDDAIKLGEGGFDAATATLTLRREFVDARGTAVVERLADRFVDSNHRELTISTSTAGGPEVPALTLRLERR